MTTKVSFATCNLLNLNLPGLRMYRDDNVWSQEAYKKKIDWTSRLISQMNADVWGFQELWHYDALKDVFETAGLNNDYKLLAPKEQKGDRIICAGAVRNDILVDEPIWIEQFPKKFRLESSGSDRQTPDISVAINSFSRPILRFKVRPRDEGKVVTVFVAHFKSKRPTDIDGEKYYRDDKEYYKKHDDALGAAISTIRRTAEATALRMIITEQIEGDENPIIVLGDLNDGQHSNTLNILTEQPKYLMGGSLGGRDTALYTVETLQEYRSLRDVYYTYKYQNNLQSLDHILVSQEFYDNSRKRIWAFEGMELINDHLNQDNYKETGTIDHGIVKATFKYDPY